MPLSRVTKNGNVTDSSRHVDPKVGPWRCCLRNLFCELLMQYDIVPRRTFRSMFLLVQARDLKLRKKLVYVNIYGTFHLPNFWEFNWVDSVPTSYMFPLDSHYSNTPPIAELIQVPKTSSCGSCKRTMTA